METLGLSDSTPRPENWLKTLFWPSIRHETDVDLVTRQGFWICAAVAAVTLVIGIWSTVWIIADALFFFLSGIGSRQRSRLAAIGAFVIYAAGSVLTGLGLVRVIFLAVLLANARGVWLSSKWRSDQTEPPPVPMNETWGDKIADRMPIAVWPYGRFFYYFLLAVEAAFLVTASYARISGRAA